MELIKPPDEYWTECERRLRDGISRLQQPPSFVETLVKVIDFQDCISSDCGSNVKKLSEAELKHVALCITAKIIFRTQLIENLDISHFLCHSYSTTPLSSIR